MSVSDKGLNAIEGTVGQGPGQNQKPRLRIIAAVVGHAVLLAGGAQRLSTRAVTAQETAPQP